MATSTSEIVPAFDFTEANALPLAVRFKRCVERARELVAANGYQAICDFPCVPSGATEAEIRELEGRLGAISLPGEYRHFLAMSRYLKIEDGTKWAGWIMGVSTSLQSRGFP
jgi:hypothetical protein